MNKWLVVYSSNTGNTKQVAQAMYEELADKAMIKDVKEKPRINEFDVIVVGFWVTRGGPDHLSKEFLKSIQNKQVVLVQTLGADSNSEHAVTSLAKAAYSVGEDCNILGTFSCRGKINPALLEARKNLPTDNPHHHSEANMKRWAAAATHPDSADLDRARAFIDNMQRKLVMLEEYNKR